MLYVKLVVIITNNNKETFLNKEKISCFIIWFVLSKSTALLYLGSFLILHFHSMGYNTVAVQEHSVS